MNRPKFESLSMLLPHALAQQALEKAKAGILSSLRYTASSSKTGAGRRSNGRTATDLEALLDQLRKTRSPHPPPPHSDLPESST